MSQLDEQGNRDAEELDVESDEHEKDDTDTGDDADEESNADDAGDSSDDADDGDDDAGDDDAEKRFKDQQGRAAKAESKAKSYKQRLIDAGLDPETGKKMEKSTPKKGKENDERITAAEERAAKAEERAQRAELRSLGITHPDDMTLVIKAAKELGIDPTEAAERKYVKAELEEKRAARKTRDATPPPRKGSGGSGSNNIAKLADKVAAGGELPKDPKLAEKVQAELARRSQALS
ncbi:MAG: hypothetical protein KGZ73_05185 [Rhizobiales bacterium]|nr:hypothetical protein [Hyphomicrobiales bacterium]